MAAKDGVPAIGPVPVPPIPAKVNAQQGGVHGAPLDPAAGQAAAKANTAFNMITWIAVGCAGASCAFFFSTIFVSTAFAIPYAVSMVATLVFGFIGDCTAQRNRGGQPAAGNPQLPGLPAGPGGQVARPKAGAGFMGGWFQAPVDPAFEDGQPVQLVNDGSSCFINSGFQEIMVWTEMKDALVATCKEWDARFTAFNKLIVWLKQHDEKSRPTADDVPLIISLIATTDFGERWYATIRLKVEAADAPEALKTFDEYVKAFREARKAGQDDPVVEEVDVAKMLHLFEFKPHWTSQNIDTFIQFARWCKDPKRNSAPRADALAALLPILCRPEYEDVYLQLVDKPLQEPKPSQVLTSFDEQVRAVIEQRGKEVQEPAEAADQPLLVAEEEAVDEVAPFFDFLMAAHFVGIARDTSAKMTGVRGFLTAVETYEKTQAAKEHRTGIALSALRNLLPADMRAGQQDGNDMLRYLFNLVDVRQYPDLFFPLAMEQRYVPYDPGADLENAEFQLQRLESHSLADRPTDPLPDGSRKLQRSEASYELYTPIPNKPSWGQELFNGVFEFHEDMGHEPVIYIDPETGEPALYKIAEERISVDALPDTFMFTLKRFGRDNFGRGVKNHMPVVMPEYIQHGDETFEIVAIMLHGGGFNGGHYVALSKKDGKWWVCDDTGPKWNHKYIYPASVERTEAAPDKLTQLEHALTYGYQYLVRRCDKSEEEQVHVLKNWPPAELPPPPAPPPAPKAKAKAKPKAGDVVDPAAKKKADAPDVPPPVADPVVEKEADPAAKEEADPKE